MVDEEYRFLENEALYNQALEQERVQGIAEIQAAIYEINEMFVDLGLLANVQGQHLGISIISLLLLLRVH